MIVISANSLEILVYCQRLGVCNYRYIFDEFIHMGKYISNSSACPDLANLLGQEL